MLSFLYLASRVRWLWNGCNSPLQHRKRITHSMDRNVPASKVRGIACDTWPDGSLHLRSGQGTLGLATP